MPSYVPAVKKRPLSRGQGWLFWLCYSIVMVICDNCLFSFDLHFY